MTKDKLGKLLAFGLGVVSDTLGDLIAAAVQWIGACL